MFEFIGAFLDAHFWTISYAITYTLGTICSLIILSRFARMFPAYIKTGSMGNENLGMFMSYSAYKDITGMDYFKIKVRDFFTATHLETIIIDALTCVVIIAVLHVAWIVAVVVGSIIASIYGIVKFVVHLRDRHIRKEEFHSALRGD